MKRSVNIAISFVVLIMIGCGAPEILYLPSPPQELVVNCISYNYHPWNAYLSLSSGILEWNEYEPILDATVKLYENDVLRETFVNDNPGSSLGTLYHSVTSTPQPGKRYKITAERPGYPTAESEFTQPDSIAIQSLSVRAIGPNAKYPENTDVQFRVEFTDPPGEDFYEIDAIHVFDSTLYTLPDGSISIYMQSQDLMLYFVDPAYEENNEAFFSAVAFNDSYFDGKTVTLDFTAQATGTNKKTYVVYLRHLSKEYYEYVKTANLQSSTSGDPFAQPVLLENNITNGYGIFGGFTQTKKPVQAQN